MRDLLTPAFASNLENLMDGDRVALWIHGHMHESFDYEIYGTRIVCNPRGYAPMALNEGFEKNIQLKSVSYIDFGQQCLGFSVNEYPCWNARKRTLLNIYTKYTLYL